MTEQQLQMSYEEMRAVATDVGAQAEQTRQILTNLDTASNRLLQTWMGASKEAFEAAYVLIKKELERTPLMLDEVSQALMQTAATIQQAEQQAAAQVSATVTTDNAS